jgi:hypothetical protein
MHQSGKRNTFWKQRLRRLSAECLFYGYQQITVKSFVSQEVIKDNSIALLSNYQKPPHDKASEGWLGSYCANRLVRLSGLWHSEHVASNYDPIFLNKMKKFIRVTYASICSFWALESLEHFWQPS